MRARHDEQEFAAWLLQIGSGLAPTKSEEPFKGAIEVPELCALDSNASLVAAMYGDLAEEDFASTVILQQMMIL